MTETTTTQSQDQAVERDFFRKELTDAEREAMAQFGWPTPGFGM